MAPGPTTHAWSDTETLWWVEKGTVRGMNVVTRQSLPDIQLPEGQRAFSVAASLAPRALFIGTESGDVLRLALPGRR